MIACKECAAPMSETAKACPKCGWANPARSGFRLTINVMLVLFVVAVIYQVGASVLLWPPLESYFL